MIQAVISKLLDGTQLARAEARAVMDEIMRGEATSAQIGGFLIALRAKGERSFLIAPIGFVSDHLEILYDLDVECAEWAKGAGVGLRRCESLNDSPEFLDCLFSIVGDRGFLN